MFGMNNTVRAIVTETKQEAIENKELHRSNTFSGGARALLSVAVFGTLGALVGHYLGRMGEERHIVKGMSATVSRILGGVGFGGIAAYVSLRDAAKNEITHERALHEKTVAEVLRDVETTAQQAEERVEATSVVPAGKVLATSLEKAL